MQAQELTKTVYAGFFVRAAAYLLDLLLSGVIVFLFRFPFWLHILFITDSFLTHPILFTFSLWDILAYLFTVAYFTIFTYVTGSTVGKKLLKLQVVSTDDSRLTLLNVIYRETIGRYLSSLLMIGYLIIGVNSEKQGLHDILCNTRVIYSCKFRKTATQTYAANPILPQMTAVPPQSSRSPYAIDKPAAEEAPTPCTAEIATDEAPCSPYTLKKSADEKVRSPYAMGEPPVVEHPSPTEAVPLPEEKLDR